MGNTQWFSASHAADPLLNDGDFVQRRRGAEVVSIVPKVPGPVVRRGFLLTDLRVAQASVLAR